jgi:iron complex outermembrane receptor protein
LLLGLAANITRVLANGKINLFTRVTDDHSAWYLPTPLVSGVDNRYTQPGTLDRQATIQYGPDGASEQVDIGKGRGWDGSISGGSLNLEFADGWRFSKSTWCVHRAFFVCCKYNRYQPLGDY